MSTYGKGICSGCNRRVVTKGGRPISHVSPGTTVECDGSGELTTETIKPEPPAITPQPEAKPLPSPAADENALRLAALRARVNRGLPLSESVAAVNEHSRRGSIDFEALADCDCPSLREAVRHYLGWT